MRKFQFSELTFYAVLQRSEKQQYIFSLQRKLIKIKTDDISDSFYLTFLLDYFVYPISSRAFFASAISSYGITKFL